MPPALPSLSLPFSGGPRGSTLSPQRYDEGQQFSSDDKEELRPSLPRHRSHSFSSLRHRNRLDRLFLLVRDNGWLIFAFVLGCLVGQAGWRWQGERVARLGGGGGGAVSSLRADDVRAGVWSDYGERGAVPLGTKVVRPEGMPECERTLLFDWARFDYGFGSTATSFLQAAFFAHVNNYTMLVSRGPNKYGTYLDHFSPVPLSCWPREEHYDSAWYLNPTEEGATLHAYHIIEDMQDGLAPRTHVNRVIVNKEDLYPLNWFAKNQTFDWDTLDSLPEMSATKPLSPADNVPALFRQRFLQFSALGREHLTLNALMQSKVSELVRRYGLDREREAPVVGVHYRGGDKILQECRPSSKLSCGNVTLHCETTLESLASVSHLYPSFDASSLSPSSANKPRLLLMTAEPDALDKFKADETCQRFEIEELPRKGGDKSFVQDEWKELSDLVRLEDTRALLSQSDLLANYVDTTIVSANSNSARIMQVRAGPKRVIDEERIRTADYYWHPMQFPPYRGRCDGLSGGCYPE